MCWQRSVVAVRTGLTAAGKTRQSQRQRRDEARFQAFVPGTRCFVLAALCVAAYCCLLLAPLVVYALAYGGAQYTEQLEHSFKAGYSAGFNAAARERLGWR